jgi:hypothetical protein
VPDAEAQAYIDYSTQPPPTNPNPSPKPATPKRSKYVNRAPRYKVAKNGFLKNCLRRTDQWAWSPDESGTRRKGNENQHE